MHTTKTPATTYTFSVTVTAPEADDDGNGYTRADVEELLKRTLGYYAAPLNRAPHGSRPTGNCFSRSSGRPAGAAGSPGWARAGPRIAPTATRRRRRPRADSFDAMDARIAAECRQDAWDAD